MGDDREKSRRSPADTVPMETEPSALAAHRTAVLEGGGQEQMPTDGGGPVAAVTGGLVEELGLIDAGRYVMRGVHAQGGQGRILVAFDERIGREIAIKELAPGFAKPSSSQGRTATPVVRFLREARVTGQLEHPNIVPVHELGRLEDGTLCYTMRLVRGRTLAKKLKECQGLTARLKLLGAFWDVCKAVAYAHSKGVIHRDIKPENVMLGEFGETVLLDWGVAKVKGEHDIRAADLEKGYQALQALDEAKTTDGVAVGTPAYMSPEQAQGSVEKIDERSDVWGLGAMLFSLLSGQPPFRGHTAMEVILKAAEGSVPRVRSLCPEAPAELAEVAEKALRRDPANRYQSAMELADEIGAYMTGGRVRAHAYSSWELFRRFAARNKAAMVAAAVVLAAILVTLVLVSLAYRKESSALQREEQARAREHQERLSAAFHLAQGYTREAQRLIDRGEILSARIYAAASLANNPAHPLSPFHDVGFEKRLPESDWLRVDARGLLFRTRHGSVTGLQRSLEAGEKVFAVAFSPDGSLVASGDDAGFLKVWSPSDGRQVFTVKAHQGRIRAVSFSSDGKQLVTAHGEVKLWEVGKVEPVRVFALPGLSFTMAAMSPDGTRIAAVADDKVEVWQVEGGDRIREMVPEAAGVESLAISPDGKLLATGHNNGAIHLVDLSTGKPVFRMKAPSLRITWVVFSPDGGLLATANMDGNIRLFETRTGRLKTTLGPVAMGAYRCAFSPDGKRLAATGDTSLVNLWDLDTGSLLASVDSDAISAVAVAFSPGGKLLATAGTDRMVRLWNLSAGTALLRLDQGVDGVAFSRDGKMVATNSKNQAVRIWNSEDGSLLRTLKGHDYTMPGCHLGMAFSPDGHRFALGSQDRKLWLWNLGTGKVERSLPGHQNAVCAVAFSPDGSHLLSASLDATARLWDADSGRELAKLSEHGRWVVGAAISPDGRWLATASGDKLVRLFDANSHEVLQRLSGHRDWVFGLDFSPDGRLLGSSGNDGEVILWEPGSGRLIRRLEGLAGSCDLVSFSADGQKVAAGDNLEAVIWEVATGKPLLRVKALGGSTQVVFSPDGKRLALIDNGQAVLYPLDFSGLDDDPLKIQKEAETEAGMVLQGFGLKILTQPEVAAGH